MAKMDGGSMGRHRTKNYIYPLILVMVLGGLRAGSVDDMDSVRVARGLVVGERVEIGNVPEALVPSWMLVQETGSELVQKRSASYYDTVGNGANRDRSNHTGTQAISTIVGLQTALDGKEPAITGGTTAQYWRGDKTWATLSPVDSALGALRLGGKTKTYYDTVGTGWIAAELAGKEPGLGNPASNGYLLSSTTGGTRSWVAPYSHPSTGVSDVTFTGAQVPSVVGLNAQGHVTGITTRNLTAANVGAATVSGVDGWTLRKSGSNADTMGIYNGPLIGIRGLKTRSTSISTNDGSEPFYITRLTPVFTDALTGRDTTQALRIHIEDRTANIDYREDAEGSPGSLYFRNSYENGDGTVSSQNMFSLVRDDYNSTDVPLRYPYVSASSVPYLDADKALRSHATVTLTELGYLDGVDGPIQDALDGKEPVIAAGTTAQYWRGDKSWQNLTTSSVAGLDNALEERVSISDEFNDNITSAGWVTIAYGGTGRSYGEFLVYDGQSGDHNLVKIIAVSSYGKNQIACIGGISYGNSPHIDSVRILYQTADRIVGGARLQVRCTEAIAPLHVRLVLDQISTWNSWDVADFGGTPDGLPAGWSVDTRAQYGMITSYPLIGSLQSNVVRVSDSLKLDYISNEQYLTLVGANKRLSTSNIHTPGAAPNNTHFPGKIILPDALCSDSSLTAPRIRFNWPDVGDAWFSTSTAGGSAGDLIIEAGEYIEARGDEVRLSAQDVTVGSDETSNINLSADTITYAGQTWQPCSTKSGMGYAENDWNTIRVCKFGDVCRLGIREMNVTLSVYTSQVLVMMIGAPSYHLPTPLNYPCVIPSIGIYDGGYLLHCFGLLDQPPNDRRILIYRYDGNVFQTGTTYTVYAQSLAYPTYD